MSGKSYTMRELKSIVDYLTENHFYSEIRGRKMWMDFANSNLTQRTWQSLKETFLKRILPEITNPYYKLNPDQIMSFKRGVDLTQKNRKLEIKPVGESKNNGKNEDNDLAGSSKHNNEDNATGEDTQCSKIVHNRASTETLILDSCYQTAEEIQQDLESSGEDREKSKKKSKPPIKSVRDFIEYTEPLTPMLQEVMDDFATDEDCSDTEQPMQIDENYIAQDEIFDAPSNPTSSQSILNPNKTQNAVKPITTEDKDIMKAAKNGEQVSENNEKPVKGTDDPLSQLEDVMVLVDEALAKDIEQELGVQKADKINKEASSFESSIQLTDSLLPNNQEAIKNTSTVEVASPAQPSPSSKINHGEENTMKVQIDTNPPNSKTNLILAEEPEQKGSDGLISIDSNEDKTNIIEPVHQQTAQSTKSPKKCNDSDEKIHEIHSDSSTGNKDVAPQGDNPCLKSVSLYAEQLVTTKYSDSDSNNKENANEQKTKEIPNIGESKEKEQQKNDGTKGKEDHQNVNENSKGKSEGIIHLSSRTTSESVDGSEINHRPLARSSLKRRKDKKIASVFGFSNGGAAKSRRLNGRKRTISHHIMHSDSSDWTSASDSEYVSPPHGRRNRYARKYLKPRSTRIMSLEEEGGLFVMLGKKIYPLVKDGKKVKNYVTFLPESDLEEEDSYWKSKYIEEKKRTADLKKKLGHSRSNGVLEEKESSISLSSVASPLNENRPNLPASRQGSIQGNELMRRDSGILEKSSNQETLKIKFTKNDQEVQLEGHWQHINPVLAQVVSMLQKEPAGKKKSESVTCVELSSGNITPVDGPSAAGVHEKINELESEIFKVIEEKHVQEQVVEQEEDQENIQADNAVEVNSIEISAEDQAQVTQRKKRGRPRKASATAVAASPAKKPKKTSEPSDAEEVKAQELLKDMSNEEIAKDPTPKVKRPIRSPRKLDDGTPKAKTTRRKSTLKVPEAPVAIQQTPAIEENLEEDDEVRYKFPSPAPKEDIKPTKTNKNSKESPKKHLPNIASPASFSHHSVNSSQGYQDSDTSPFNIGIRKRKRLSASSLSIKARKMQRKRSRSYPLLKHVSDQSDSSSSISFKIVRREQTINSQVYKSDSYQFLMANRQKLENITEANNEMDSLTDRIRELRDELLQVDDNRNKTDAASSSILSLPLSPELSIVENISISKSALAEISDIPTIHEAGNNTAPKTCNNKYLLSEVDVSMPLMVQNCELQKTYKKHLMAALSILSDTPNSAGRNFSNNSSMNFSIASESILKNLSGANVETSDSLDRRLEQLLLESAQKPVNQNRVENMEVDTQVKKKSGSRKRCSTPHKKKSVQNTKKVNEEPVIIEEESRAQCSRGGRRSCPPSVNIVYCNQNPPHNLDNSVNDESIDVSTITKRRRVKKDIIKVKIMRPKDKLQKKKSPKKKNASRNSGIAEGDNESGVFLQGFDDSSDLIHNHSETCLQIGDCMGDSDSVEFIETTTKSIISLNSTSSNSDNKENVCGNSMESRKSSPELHCDNAQCATNLRDARATEVRSADSGNTVYFTPFVSRCNSALTEDLSNEEPLSRPPHRPSKWYLLSDEESNTNYFDVQENNDTPTYGSKLEQIFPVTCAVPDLSTITEMSANENSQKQSID